MVLGQVKEQRLAWHRLPRRACVIAEVDQSSLTGRYLKVWRESNEIGVGEKLGISTIHKRIVKKWLYRDGIRGVIEV